MACVARAVGRAIGGLNGEDEMSWTKTEINRVLMNASNGQSKDWARRFLKDLAVHKFETLSGIRRSKMKQNGRKEEAMPTRT
jgi:hypothetical protein